MPKRPPGPPKDISSRQLHVMARAVLLVDPTITSGEWKERLYTRLLAFGFSYPRPDQLATAMDRVERHLEKKFGPRPAAPPVRCAERLTVGRDHEPLTRVEAAGWMVKLGAIAKAIPERTR